MTRKKIVSIICLGLLVVLFVGLSLTTTACVECKDEHGWTCTPVQTVTTNPPGGALLQQGTPTPSSIVGIELDDHGQILAVDNR